MGKKKHPDSLFQWIDDLFGGRRKDYKTGRIHQNSAMRSLNKKRGKGDYPHATQPGYKGKWHYSNGPKSKRQKLNWNQLDHWILYLIALLF